jgi:perosamine synthetase
MKTNWIKDMSNNSYEKTIQFIRDKFNTNGFIPLHEPRFIGNEKKYLAECIDSTFVSSVGVFVDKFEIEMAKYTGAVKAVSCVNGTNALHLALKLVGVKQGDEVITQPLTFIATANAISYCNAKPVFVDVDMDTMGLSPESLRIWLEENVEMRGVKVTDSPKLPETHPQAYNKNSGKRIAACVPMHTFGHPCKIDEILKICDKFNIECVEDAAESLGSHFKGQHTGTFGKIGVLSFNGNKVITSGGGGMLLFNDETLAKKAKHLTSQAKVPHAWEFVHDEIGYNYRMPSINAALGVAQLEKIHEFITAKRNLATEYMAYFENMRIEYAKEPNNSKSNYWLNAIIMKDRETRDGFLEYTNGKGVMTRPVWQLMSNVHMYKDCQVGVISNAEWLADRVVNIPSSVVI